MDFQLLTRVLQLRDAKEMPVTLDLCTQLSVTL